MTNAISKNPIRDLMNSESVKNKFAEMLGNKAPGFIVSVLNAVQQNENLRNAEPNSVLFAAATAATLDLPVNQNLGFAYIIPYRQKKQDGSYMEVAQFQMGYKGFIQLAQRSGQFKAINATDVREGELVEYNRLTGEITFDWTIPNREKLPIVGYVSFFQLNSGFTKSLYMTVDEMKAHGAKYSKTFKFGVWNSDFDSMALKTVTKLILSKYAPLSVEMQRAILNDQAVIKDYSGENIEVPSEYVDNEDVKLDVKAVSDRKESERVLKFISGAKDIAELESYKQYCTNDELAEAYKEKYKELFK